MKPIAASRLTVPFSEKDLDFKTTDQVPPLEGIVGQERAASAIQFGLSIRNAGYNIFVCGLSGTGRTTSVLSAVRKVAEGLSTPDDWCYVHNFGRPDRPDVIRLPAGKAAAFRRDMEALVEELRVEVPKAFEAKLYEEHRGAIIKAFQRRKEQLFQRVETAAKAAGFQIQQTPAGITFTPLVEGKPLSEEDAEKLTDQARRDIKTKQEVLSEQLADVLRRIREAEKETRKRLSDLEKQIASSTVSPRIQELRDEYGGFPELAAYLDEVEKNMVSSIEDFQEKKEVEVLPGLRMPGRESPLGRYAVNVLIDRSLACGAPVVEESNPTSYNLSGRIEYRPQLGAMVTDFSMIKAGALHAANGGYLILQAIDVLRNYYAWETLKRALKTRSIVIEDLNEQFRLINTPSLKPEPVPADLKVILIGPPLVYYLLHAYDDDFRKLFKVKADFSSFMKRDAHGVRNYCSFISRLCADEKLRPFDRGAVGAVLEHGSRIVQHQEHLTTRFGAIADVIREAVFWAEAAGQPAVSRKHVKRALEEKVYRSNLIEQRIQELIAEGTLMIDTAGASVGQINGLSVATLGDYSFGRPSRITARVYVGRAGMVNIDREIKLAGAIHNKGFLILSGYIGERFGGAFPLVFSSTICFEQSYDEIEGDSASSAELYVLLSALADVPLRQSVAVTGSVNQKGEIQPIGGVNEKIEGFYATCKARGLTGDQGVLIPRANIRNLVLKDEVVAACRAGRFNVWAASTIDEGIEVLTGVPAGSRRKDGTYPPRTVNARVASRLVRLADDYRRAHRPAARGRSPGLNRRPRGASEEKRNPR